MEESHSSMWKEIQVWIVLKQHIDIITSISARYLLLLEYATGWFQYPYGREKSNLTSEIADVQSQLKRSFVLFHSLVHKEIADVQSQVWSIKTIASYLTEIANILKLLEGITYSTWKIIFKLGLIWQPFEDSALCCFPVPSTQYPGIATRYTGLRLLGHEHWAGELYCSSSPAWKNVSALCALCWQGVQKLYELIVTFFGN